MGKGENSKTETKIPIFLILKQILIVNLKSRAMQGFGYLLPVQVLYVMCLPSYYIISCILVI